MTKSDDLRARMAGKAKPSDQKSQLREAMKPAGELVSDQVSVEVETEDGAVKMRFAGPGDEVAFATAELVRHLQEGTPSIALVETSPDDMT